MNALPAPDPRKRHAGPNPTARYPAPIDLRRPDDLVPAPMLAAASDNPGGSYVTRVTRARVRRHLPGFLVRRTRYEQDMRAVAASDLNAAALAVVALVDGEPWFAFDPDGDRIERTPLQRALCMLARDVHFVPAEHERDEAHAAA